MKPGAYLPLIRLARTHQPVPAHDINIELREHTPAPPRPAQHGYSYGLNILACISPTYTTRPIYTSYLFTGLSIGV